jgi:hypothetical protein
MPGCPATLLHFFWSCISPPGRRCFLATPLLARHEPGTPSPEAKKQAHPARSAAGHAGLSGDAAVFCFGAAFHHRAVGAFWRPPCWHGMSQAPLAPRPKSRLIRRGRPQGMPGCPATPLHFFLELHFTAGP